MRKASLDISSSIKMEVEWINYVNMFSSRNAVKKLYRFFVDCKWFKKIDIKISIFGGREDKREKLFRLIF